MKLLSGLVLAFVFVAGTSCTMSYGEPQAAVSQGCFRRPWRISAPPVPIGRDLARTTKEPEMQRTTMFMAIGRLISVGAIGTR
jgi:hypothetical protein